jgi:hypothetical protein
MMFPRFFKFERIAKLAVHRRFHRSHFTHIRQDRLRALMKNSHYTIFVLGAKRQSVPIREPALLDSRKIYAKGET